MSSLQERVAAALALPRTSGHKYFALATQIVTAVADGKQVDGNQKRLLEDASMSGALKPTAVEGTDFVWIPEDTYALVKSQCAIVGDFPRMAVQNPQTDKVEVEGWPQPVLFRTSSDPISTYRTLVSGRANAIELLDHILRCDTAPAAMRAMADDPVQRSRLRILVSATNIATEFNHLLVNDTTLQQLGAVDPATGKPVTLHVLLEERRPNGSFQRGPVYTPGHAPDTLTPIETWRRGLCKGSRVDACDKKGAWYDSVITEVIPETQAATTAKGVIAGATNLHNVTVTVDFRGWDKRFSEKKVLPLEWAHIHPLHTHTRPWRQAVRPGDWIEYRNEVGHWFAAVVAAVDHTRLPQRVTLSFFGDPETRDASSVITRTLPVEEDKILSAPRTHLKLDAFIATNRPPGCPAESMIAPFATFKMDLEIPVGLVKQSLRIATEGCCMLDAPASQDDRYEPLTAVPAPAPVSSPAPAPAANPRAATTAGDPAPVASDAAGKDKQSPAASTAGPIQRPGVQPAPNTYASALAGTGTGNTHHHTNPAYTNTTGYTIGGGYNTGYGYGGGAVSRYTPGIAGLRNLGNTCYFNSMIQCLGQCTALRKYFTDDAAGWGKDLNRTSTFGCRGQLAMAFSGLMKELWGGTTGHIIPDNLRRVFVHKQDTFNNFLQQDSQEFLGFMLDLLLEDTCRIVGKKPYLEDADCDGTDTVPKGEVSWSNYQARMASGVTDMFAGQFKTENRCVACDRKSVKFEPFLSWSLPLPPEYFRSVEIYYFGLYNSRPAKYKFWYRLDEGVTQTGRTVAEWISNEIATSHKRADEAVAAALAAGEEVQIVEDDDKSAEELQPSVVDDEPTEPITGTTAPSPAASKTKPSPAAGGGAGKPTVRRIKRPAFPVPQPNDLLITYTTSWPCIIKQVVPHWAHLSVALQQALAKFGESAAMALMVFHVPGAPHYDDPTPMPADSGSHSAYLGLGGDPAELAPLGAAASSGSAAGASASSPAVGGGSGGVERAASGGTDGGVIRSAVTGLMAVTGMAALGRMMGGTGSTSPAASSASPVGGAGAMVAAGGAGVVAGSVMHPEARAMLEGAIAARKYPAEAIDWPIDYDEPDPEDRARLIREEEERRAALGGFAFEDDGAGIPRAPRQCKLLKRPTNPIGPRQEDWTNAWIRIQNPHFRAATDYYGRPYFNPHSQVQQFTSPADPLVIPTKWFNGVAVPFITNRQVYAAVAARLKRLLKLEGKKYTEDKPPYKLGYFDYNYDTDRLKMDEKYWVVSTAATKLLPCNDDPFVPRRDMQLTVDFESAVFEELFDGKEAVRSTKHTSLNSEAPGSEISLESCVERFEAEEMLDGDNKLYCSRCKEHQPVRRSMQLWRLPNILVVHFKRFQFANNAGELGLVLRGKIHSLVKFPTRGLDLSEHIKGQSIAAGDAVYDLFAVSHHVGMAGYGHYTAHGLHEPSGKWYRFDDDRVVLAKEEDCVTPSAYVLFYKKRGAGDDAASADVAAHMASMSLTGGGASAAGGAGVSATAGATPSGTSAAAVGATGVRRDLSDAAMETDEHDEPTGIGAGYGNAYGMGNWPYTAP